MSPIVDVGYICCAVSVPVLVAYGIFSDVPGGGMPKNIAFPWHPVLMALAFPGLMSLGRWAYICGDGTLGKPTRRIIHLVFMIAAALVGACGYYMMYKAHAPKNEFFGYEFDTGKWKSFSRCVHVYSGYTTLALVLAQVVMGFMKYANLPEKVYKFHGVLGKITLCVANFTMLSAIYIWGWERSLKSAVAIPVIIIIVANFLAQAPESNADDENEAAKDV